jgi:hypothetical protein
VSRPPLATCGALLAATLAASARAAPGQQRDSALVEFLAEARSGTARFRDPASALAAGYRPIGPETPAMGQHWLHPALLVEGRLHPAAPQVLAYATVAGRRMLVGVAYAIPLGPGQAPPDSPVAQHLWHAHEGTVDEESLADSHGGSGAAQRDRVAVLHAWIWVENPAGPFAAENWALPYVRMGIAPPRATSQTAELAAKALALGSGGGRLWPDSTRAPALAQVVSAFADRVIEWRRRRVGADSLSSAEAESLAGLWNGLARALRSQQE